MYLAVAVEYSPHPSKKTDYRIWYLTLNAQKDVIAIGVVSKEELLASLMEDWQAKRPTRWRAFLKDQECSVPIEFTDFVAMNMFENTHFGNLPTLPEFQETLNCMRLQLEVRMSA